MRKYRTAVLIPVVALIVIGFSAVAFADTASTGESYTSTVTLSTVTLPEHTSYISDEYFGVINVSVDDGTVVAATMDTQGRVVVTAVGTGSTTVRYWFKTAQTDSWTMAKVPIVVSDTATKVTTSASTGLVFPQTQASIAKGSNYTLTGIMLDGVAVDASSLLWVSSSDSVFTVEANTGKVTAVGTGSALLYAVDPKTNAAANINLSVY